MYLISSAGAAHFTRREKIWITSGTGSVRPTSQLEFEDNNRVPLIVVI